MLLPSFAGAYRSVVIGGSTQHSSTPDVSSLEIGQSQV